MHNKTPEYLVRQAMELIETTDRTLQDIREELGLGQKAMFNIFKKYPEEFRKDRKFKTYSRSKSGPNNSWYGVKGSDHPVYKGIIDDCKGYKLIVKPDWYTGRTDSHHIFYHHFIVCLEMGWTEIPPCHVVHHCDMDPHNNDFSNLVVLTVSEHIRLHKYIKERATTISKESTLKWVEAVRAGHSYDIV